METFDPKNGSKNATKDTQGCTTKDTQGCTENTTKSVKLCDLKRTSFPPVGNE